MPTRKPEPKKARPAPKSPPDRLTNDQLLSEDQASELLGGVTPNQLRGMRERREVTYVRMASGCRYYRSSLIEWIEARTVNAGEFE